jgi:hypothetical protein
LELNSGSVVFNVVVVMQGNMRDTIFGKMPTFLCARYAQCRLGTTEVLGDHTGSMNYLSTGL